MMTISFGFAIILGLTHIHSSAVPLSKNCNLAEVSNKREQILSLKWILIFKVTASILNNAKFNSTVHNNLYV